MLFSLLYLLLRLLLRVPSSAGEHERELELIVLHHEVKVLKRKAGRAKLRRTDKVFLTALSRVLPRQRWSSFVVRDGADVLRRGAYDHPISQVVCVVVIGRAGWGGNWRAE